VMNIVTKNASKHQKAFLEAQDKYRLKLTQTVKDLLAKVSGIGKIEPQDLYSAADIVKPVSYHSDYLKSIEMLNEHVNETVELTQTDFSNLVKDDWEWKADFIETTDSYGVKHD
jgi:hypothetical protein